jgi:hypothetical protein
MATLRTYSESKFTLCPSVSDTVGYEATAHRDSTGWWRLSYPQVSARPVSLTVPVPPPPPPAPPPSSSSSSDPPLILPSLDQQLMDDNEVDEIDRGTEICGTDNNTDTWAHDTLCRRIPFGMSMVDFRKFTFHSNFNM